MAHRANHYYTRREANAMYHANGHISVPALPVKPVDTVGAGDAFAGAYAAWRVEGMDELRAIRYANCAAPLLLSNPAHRKPSPTELPPKGFFGN